MDRERWLPWLLPLVALLPDPLAGLPRLSYYFRDFTVTFYPLRLFVARELREGRWPFWNPYLHEGTFAFPAFYPVDLLLALHPSPELLSWLLTLHLPLAALSAYALARDLSLSRSGSFGAGAVYVLSGFALSSLNLVVFLQALALAPLVVLAFRRAARGGGRAISVAGVALALSISTLAVEFVAQAAVLAILLGQDARGGRRGVGRLLASLLLGLALAAVPIALVAGMLPETQRGFGFTPDILYANELHPAALVQALVPNLFGQLDVPPAEVFWGARFFTKGFPYFASLYLGPCVVALAGAGLRGALGRRALILAALATLGLLFSLGQRGWLAPALYALPGLSAFRFPSKAFFVVHFAVAFLAGAGLDRLRSGRPPRSFAAVCLALALAALAGALLLVARPGLAGAAFALSLADPVPFAHTLAFDFFRTGLLALLGLSIWAGVRSKRLAPRRGAVLLALVIALDLARAGAGLNSQVPAGLLSQTPELLALRLDRLEGQRVFSFETERSPAVRRFLGTGPRHRTLLSFVLQRRVLGPYTNINDGVETAWGKDLTSFGGVAPELAPEQYDLRELRSILPLLRGAAVSRILSLDPLDGPSLRLLAEGPAGPPGVSVRAYAVADPLPRANVACRVVPARSPAESFARSLDPAFDGRRDVALEEGAPATCTEGRVRRLSAWPGREEYEAELDGVGYLAMRDSYARGWVAEIDGQATPVLRANGKYRAVCVTAGRHRVSLHYQPPGLNAGLLVMGAGLLAGALLALRRAAPEAPS